MLSNNKFYAHKPPPTNKQYKNSVAYLTECPEFFVENGNAIE